MLRFTVQPGSLSDPATWDGNGGEVTLDFGIAYIASANPADFGFSVRIYTSGVLGLQQGMTFQLTGTDNGYYDGTFEITYATIDDGYYAEFYTEASGQYFPYSNCQNGTCHITFTVGGGGLPTSEDDVQIDHDTVLGDGEAFTYASLSGAGTVSTYGTNSLTILGTCAPFPSGNTGFFQPVDTSNFTLNCENFAMTGEAWRNGYVVGALGYGFVAINVSQTMSADSFCTCVRVLGGQVTISAAMITNSTANCLSVGNMADGREYAGTLTTNGTLLSHAGSLGGTVVSAGGSSRLCVQNGDLIRLSSYAGLIDGSQRALVIISNCQVREGNGSGPPINVNDQAILIVEDFTTEENHAVQSAQCDGPAVYDHVGINIAGSANVYTAGGNPIDPNYILTDAGGNYVPVSQTYVLAGHAYGPSSSLAGSLVLPLVSNVRSGVVFGPGGTGLVGTLIVGAVGQILRFSKTGA